MVLLIIAIILTYIFREKIKTFKYEKQIRYSLAFLMMIVEMSYYWRILYCGSQGTDSNLLTYFPIQVCTWSAILTVFLLTTETKWIFDYCVFVCLTLGLIPLATPAVIVQTGPSYLRYYQFFLEHMIPIYAVFYMMFIRGFKIRLKAIWKPILVLGIGSLIAVILNTQIPDANYFYLGNSTAGASLVNIMPENIFLRLLIYGLIVIPSFLILYGIFYLIDYLKDKKNKKVEVES
ncbi:MAG: YwaF family protein [Acholeplasmatales bacterium]|nr:YwaF family protein [Acholeplasmatales bacterium]